jgi:pyruvate/2-oxoglutarate dehydrogenase complex dihydrolipoamide acyltransferase (E2) component
MHMGEPIYFVSTTGETITVYGDAQRAIMERNGYQRIGRTEFYARQQRPPNRNAAKKAPRPPAKSPEALPDTAANTPDATPAAAALAAEAGIPLRTIAGSGKAGKITLADVRTAVNGN